MSNDEITEYLLRAQLALPPGRPVTHEGPIVTLWSDADEADLDRRLAAHHRALLQEAMTPALERRK